MATAAITQPWEEGDLFGDDVRPDGPTEAEQYFRTGTALVTIFGFPSTALGLVFLIRQQLQQARVRRRELSPHVRVDVLPSDLALCPDISIEGAPYYESTSQAVKFGAVDSEGPRISAWLRNLQTHPLGTAYDIEAVFAVAALPPGGTTTVTALQITTPYLYRDKPVRIELARFPANWSVEVSLVRFRYADLYESRRYQLPDANEGVHGRLTCWYDGSGFEARPRFASSIKALAEENLLG